MAGGREHGGRIRGVKDSSVSNFSLDPLNPFTFTHTSAREKFLLTYLNTFILYINEKKRWVVQDIIK